MDERFAAALALLPRYLSQHVILSVAALAAAIAVSLPLAWLAVRRERARWPILAVVSLIQTIPGLALLALFYPLLLALSALALKLAGFSIPALGFLPALLALTLYAMLPIVRNTVTGLTGIDAAAGEAADAVGMTPGQKLWQVEVPLAAPVIMAGIRTAAVWTIGAATLSTTVGQTSLGNFIFSGLQTENWISVLTGCFAAVGLALVADLLLGLIETGLARRDRRYVLAGALGLLAGTALALAPLVRGQEAAQKSVYVVGAKNFSEQYILAELIGARLAATGAVVEKQQGLGSAVIFRALAAGDIDVYVDYSGTLWANVMQRHDTPPADDMLGEITRWMKERYGITVLGRLGFENAYVLAMRGERAAALNIKSIADLVPKAPQLALGSDLEFLSRPEWAALRDAYGLKFASQRSFNPTFMYRALQDGTVDVISAFSSDGRIAAQKLTVLTDPKHAIPAYDAVVLLSPRRADDARLKQALMPLIGAIPVTAMREANYLVDRNADKKTPAQAAKFLADRLHLN